MKSSRAQWIILAAALLMLGTAMAWDLYSEYVAADAREREQLEAHARVVDENLGRQLFATNLALESIRGELPDLMARKEGRDLVNHRLRFMSQIMLGVRTLVMLDAEGTVLSSNREELIGKNFREREYFQAAIGSRDPAAIHVSPPYKTVLGVFAMNLAKVIRDSRGKLGGVIVATLDPEYFSTLLNSIRYATDMRASIVHGDGTVFVNAPPLPGVEGMNLAQPGTFFTRHRESGQRASLFTGMAFATGDQRMMAQRTVQTDGLHLDAPFVLAVSRDKEAIFSDWRREAYMQGGVFALIVLMSTLGLLFHRKRQLAYDRAAAADEARREQTDKDLRASEARFRDLTEMSSDFYWESDAEHRLTMRTESKREAAEGVFRDQSPLGKRRWEVASIAPDESGWHAYRATLDAHLPFRDFEIARPRANDSVHHVSISGKPVFEASGEFKGYRGVGADITERKRAEAFLRTRLQLAELSQTGSLDELLQAALDGAEEVTGSRIGFFHFVDADQENLSLQAWSTNTVKHMCTAEGKGQHYAISAAGVWVDAFHTREPVIHNDYASLAHKKDLPEGHAPVTRELVVPVVRDGRVTEILGVGNKATDYAQQDVEAVKMIASMVQDLIDRRRAEDSLRSERALLRQITVSSPVGIVVAHRSGRITLANQAAEAILGRSMDEITRRNYDAPAWKHTDAAGNPFPVDQLPVARVLATGEPVFEVEHGIEWPDGRRVLLSVNAAPLFDASGAIDGVVASISDITERRRSEAEIHRINAELERRVEQRTHELLVANRELESFSYSVSHDLRAPLRAIEGFSSLLEKEYAAQLDERGRDYFKRVRGGATRMARLIDDMLNLSRISRQELHRGPVSLSALAREAAEELQAAEPERRVEWAIAPDISTEGDSGLLRIALQNLIGNAWKYSSKREIARIEFGICHRNGGPAYFVRDNGEGFDMAYADKLFGAFQRLHSPGEFPGTGIGLATVKRIVHRHNGGVGAEGRLHEGATFYFTL